MGGPSDPVLDERFSTSSKLLEPNGMALGSGCREPQPHEQSAQILAFLQRGGALVDLRHVAHDGQAQSRAGLAGVEADTFASTLTDAWEEAAKRSGPVLTFHDFTGTPDRRIDYVFVRGLRPVTARVATDHHGPRYPSDHFPVVVDLR